VVVSGGIRSCAPASPHQGLGTVVADGPSLFKDGLRFRFPLCRASSASGCSRRGGQVRRPRGSTACVARERLEWQPAIAYALREFQAAPATRTVCEVIEEVGFSARRFSEIFRHEVGLTPNLVQLLLRFARCAEREGVAEPEILAAVERRELSSVQLERPRGAPCPSGSGRRSRCAQCSRPGSS
jgi:AraC-like DNA-binding protein